MKWRHAVSKIPKWFTATSLLKGTPSRRQVASCVGLMVWNNYMSQAALLTIAIFLEICKDNSPKVGPRQQVKDRWNEPSPVQRESLDALGVAMDSVARTNKWHSGRLPPNFNEVIHVASDASDDYGGWLTFQSDGQIDTDSIRTVKWNSKMRPAHIFLKELLAAVLAIEDVLTKHSDVRVIRIAVDNMAAGFCLRRMYSNNQQALKLLIRIHAQLGEHITLDIVNVRGVDNAADCPSRNAVLEEHRNTATWREFVASATGLPRIETTVNRNPKSGQLRHDEEDGDVQVFVDASELLTEQLVEESIPDSQPADAFSDAEIAIYLTGSESVTCG